MDLYNLKIIESGKRIEIYKINNYAVIKNNESKNKTGRKGKTEISEKEKELNSKTNRKSTLNNARNKIIRLIKANEDMQTFITLTYAKESNYKDSKKHLNNLFNKLRKDYNNLKYLWVLDYGSKNKRLHYHVLTNIGININLSTSKEKKSKEHKKLERSFSKKYWKYGFVDIRNLRQEDNTNIALYVACYITKDLLKLKFNGYRIYGYSNKTLNKPIIKTYYNDTSLEELIQAFKEHYDITYTNSYEIGYINKYKEDIKGMVTYMDLIEKE